MFCVSVLSLELARKFLFKNPVKCKVIFNGHCRYLMKVTIHVTGKQLFSYWGKSAGLIHSVAVILIQHRIQIHISSSL